MLSALHSATCHRDFCKPLNNLNRGQRVEALAVSASAGSHLSLPFVGRGRHMRQLAEALDAIRVGQTVTVLRMQRE
jgi:hypothetical protein